MILAKRDLLYPVIMIFRIKRRLTGQKITSYLVITHLVISPILLTQPSRDMFSLD